MPKEIEINSNRSLYEAISKMDTLNRKLLLVIDEDNLFISLLSIGDIQRYLIKYQTLENPIHKALRTNIRVASTTDSAAFIKEQMITFRMEFMPVINEKREVVNIIYWEDIIEDRLQTKYKNIDCPVVIMAGGKGERLKPITNIIPKPLIPIGDKTILEYIIDHYERVGCNNFYLSVNYKADMIKDYFREKNRPNTNLKYFEEKMPLGTAGSLHLIQNHIKTTFFVNNCDILIDEDYSNIYDFHKQNNFDLTVVSALKHYPIPYGILNVEENGILKDLVEKPNITYQVNSGMYILEPHLINLIPPNQLFHITHLIEKIQKQGGKVGVFPVSEKSWSDIGEWKMYNETAQKLGHKPFIIKNAEV